MENTLAQMQMVQSKAHPFCLVCSGSNPYGMALRFEPGADGTLRSRFHPHAGQEGYQGLLHGGVTASVLDGIMTNCLFAEGIIAVTAQLNIRYREPVAIGPEILLEAFIEKRHPPVYHLKAELHQDGVLKAQAEAKFMEMHD